MFKVLRGLKGLNISQVRVSCVVTGLVVALGDDYWKSRITDWWTKSRSGSRLRVT